MFIEINSKLYNSDMIESIELDPKRKVPFMKFVLESGRSFTKNYADMEECLKEYERIKDFCGLPDYMRDPAKWRMTQASNKQEAINDSASK